MKDMKPKSVIIVGLMAVVLASGTVIFRTLEDWTWIESFYFTVVTTTTVGYGDLHPTTDESRLVASFFVLIGVAVLVTAIGHFGSYLTRRREHEIKQDNK